MHHMTKGLQSGMRSKKSLQSIQHTNSTKSSSRQKRHYSDVIRKEITSPPKTKNTATGFAKHSNARMYKSRQWRLVTHDGIIVFEQKRKTVRRSSKVLVVQAAKWHIVVSDTQAKVHIKELGAHLCVHLWKIDRQCHRWEDYAMNLGFLLRGRQEKVPDFHNVRK